MVRTALIAAGLAISPTAVSAQTTSTSTSAPTSTTTTAAPTTTTTPAVTRVEDLVCSEPVNQVATCIDPQGRIVTRIDDLAQTTTTLAPFTPPPPHGARVATPEEQAALERVASPPQPTTGRALALTG